MRFIIDESATDARPESNFADRALEFEGTTMADRTGLKLVGFIFASVTLVVMLTTGMVVKGYADGAYSLETAHHLADSQVSLTIPPDSASGG
jgi:hypothetical protein